MVVWRAPQEYDRYGNMPCVQNSNSNEPCPQWAFDPSTNQLSTSQGFAYDAAGDLTTDVTGAATRTYAWDAEGRLTQVTDNGGNTTTSYVYNALGQEVELKTVGSWQLEQVFDPQGQRVGYYSVGNSQWLLAYVPWRGRELAKYASTTSFNFFHPNALRSAAISTDQTGTVDDDMAFYPWGQVWLNAGSNTYDTHFAGIHAGLQGSNLIDFTMDEAPYRFYAPNPGRWHSPDPLGGDITNPQSLNRYAYVLNNPVSFVDPLGLQGGCPPGSEQAGICRNGTFYPPGGAVNPSNPFTNPGWNWDEFDLLQVLTGWSLVYQGTVNIPQLAGPEGELPEYGTQWDLYLVYPEYGVVLPDQAIQALQQGVARAGGIVVRINAVPTLGQCASQAAKKSAVSLGLDAAGFIPGESIAVSSIQVGVGLASTAYSLAQGETTGSILGGAGTAASVLGPIAKQAGWGVAKALPFIGTGLNVAGTLNDLNTFNTNFQGCLAGTN